MASAIGVQLLCVLVALSLLIVPASAQELPSPPPPPPEAFAAEGTVGWSTPPAGDQGAVPTAPPACNPLDGCPFTECELIIDDDSIFPDGLVWDSDPAVRPIPASADAGDVSEYPLRVLDEVTFGPVGVPTLIDPIELYERARAELDPPDPPLMTAPPKDGLLFVKMPAWYWLEPGYWDEYSASAESPGGRLVVTVTAEPVMARWDPGDGSQPILCFDAGREFIIGLSPWRGTECMHIYQHSSTMATDGSDTWVLDVEVLFVASWTMAFDNDTEYDRGAIDSDTRQATLPLQVGEIQAIVID